MAELTLTFLGAGSMNGSILRGVLAAGTEAGGVRATTRSAASAEALHRETGVEVFAGESDPEANRKAVAGAEAVPSAGGGRSPLAADSTSSLRSSARAFSSRRVSAAVQSATM